MNYINENEKQVKGMHNNRFKRTIFVFLIGLTIVQQMPIIKEIFYNQIRVILYLSFGLFSIVSLGPSIKFFKNTFLKIFLSAIIYSILLFIIIKMNKMYVSNVFELLIPFGILLCSLNTKFNKKQLNNLLIFYVLISVILGISSIFYYGEGFIITKSYFLLGKNQIGPILGISSIIIIVSLISKKQFIMQHINFIFKIIILLLLLLSILVIRNRASIVSICVVIILMLIREYKFKSNIKNIYIVHISLIIVTILFLLGSFDGIINLVYNSLFDNYEITDMNSLSAGRVNVYKVSFDFIMNNPILGELGSTRFIYSTPHNYVLNKWVKLGIIGSLPLIVFYIYLYVFIFREFYMLKQERIFTLPLWVLIFSLIVSLFEYTYPYGPGVSQIMLWFLLGQYFRNNNKNQVL